MIKFVCTVEDQEFTIEAIGQGNYKLTAEDKNDEEKGEKIINSEEAAALLFCSFDVFTDESSLDKVWEVAQNAQKGFPVQLIP